MSHHEAPPLKDRHCKVVLPSGIVGTVLPRWDVSSKVLHYTESLLSVKKNTNVPSYVLSGTTRCTIVRVQFSILWCTLPSLSRLFNIHCQSIFTVYGSIYDKIEASFEAKLHTNMICSIVFAMSTFVSSEQYTISFIWLHFLYPFVGRFLSGVSLHNYIRRLVLVLYTLIVVVFSKSLKTSADCLGSYPTAACPPRLTCMLAVYTILQCTPYWYKRQVQH